jgi:hypothetical protein
VSRIIEMSSVEAIQARIAVLRGVPTAHPLNSSIRTQAQLHVASLSIGVAILDSALTAFRHPSDVCTSAFLRPAKWRQFRFGIVNARGLSRLFAN